jgi:hypothetical protein
MEKHKFKLIQVTRTRWDVLENGERKKIEWVEYKTYKREHKSYWNNDKHRDGFYKGGDIATYEYRGVTIKRDMGNCRTRRSGWGKKPYNWEFEFNNQKYSDDSYDKHGAIVSINQMFSGELKSNKKLNLIKEFEERKNHFRRKREDNTKAIIDISIKGYETNLSEYHYQSDNMKRATDKIKNRFKPLSESALLKIASGLVAKASSDELRKMIQAFNSRKIILKEINQETKTLV